MTLLSKPSPCRPAGLSSNSTIPSIVSHNINSLSSTNPGGVTGRFAKVITLLSFLLLSHTIVCLQDVRLPRDDYINSISSLFPNHVFHATASSSSRGGVVTAYPCSLRDTHTVVTNTIDDGFILATTFKHKFTQFDFTVINTYLDASSNITWERQITKLKAKARGPNTFILGDFNHAPDHRDRSGYHADRPKYCTEKFDSLLTELKFEEVHQKYHTYYANN